MAKGTPDIIADALDLLGRGTGVGQAVPAEDYATIEGFIDPLYRQLAADGIVEVADRNNIPLAVYVPLTWLLANAAAPKFDMPQDDAKRMQTEIDIRRIATNRALTRPVKVAYF